MVLTLQREQSKVSKESMEMFTKARRFLKKKEPGEEMEVVGMLFFLIY